MLIVEDTVTLDSATINKYLGKIGSGRKRYGRAFTAQHNCAWIDFTSTIRVLRKYMQHAKTEQETGKLAR